jgi:ATP-binding cassette subfamily B multidrug efflux pump
LNGNRIEIIKHPEKLSSYFKAEVFPLALVTVTGILYNVGMVAGPWFEGRMVQCLYDILNRKAAKKDMVRLAVAYLIVIFMVQACRAAKRFFVRRFANDTARNMRHMLYNNLVWQSKSTMEKESTGSMMTRAVSDVDACVEGMRKFTTEIFDTGVVLLSYLVFLFRYDFRLTLLSCLFIPLAYFSAHALRTPVYRAGSAAKISSGKLNTATLDRIRAALTYRVYGREENRDAAYEERLSDYEKTAVRSGIL